MNKKRTVSLIMLMLLMAFPLMSAAEGQSGISLTTGLPTDHAYKPLVVQFDNEPGARPQFNISKADVVYEMELYDGGYTRYTAVYNDTIPEFVEPVRSARMVSVDIYKDWGGAFIHHGGQDMAGTDAYQYMRDTEFAARWDGMTGTNFSRDKSRKAPHNSRAESGKMMEGLEAEIQEKSPFKFSADNATIKGDSAIEFSIPYREGSYHPSYQYNEGDGLYYRYYNGSPMVDGVDEQQIACTNVIIMKVKTSWYGGASDRPVFELTGSNQCDYFIGGKHFTGTWNRESVDSNTQYLDDEGNEVNLLPGKTFVQMISDDQNFVIAQ